MISKKMQRLAYALLPLAVIVAAWLYLFPSMSATEPPAERLARVSAPEQLTVKVESQEISVPANVLMHSPMSSLPESLVGTEMLGGLVVDNDGNFIPSNTSLDLFNYFFTASGEESLATIRQRIEAIIYQQLFPPADQQALDFLQQFIDYRDAGADFKERINYEGMNLREQAEALKALRREYYGEELADTLFAQEELVRELYIAKKETLENKHLSPEQREALLNTIDQQFPESIKAGRKAAARPLASQQMVRSMLEKGASETDIYNYRKQEFGEDAAIRLQALDNNRAHLQQQVDEFIAFTEDLEPGYSRDRQSQIQTFLDSRYDQRMAARIRVLAIARGEGL